MQRPRLRCDHKYSLFVSFCRPIACSALSDGDCESQDHDTTTNGLSVVVSLVVLYRICDQTIRHLRRGQADRSFGVSAEPPGLPETGQN